MNRIGHRVYTYTSSETFTEILKSCILGYRFDPQIFTCADKYLYLVWDAVWYRSDKVVTCPLFIASECWAGAAYRVVFISGTQVDFHPISDVEIEIIRVFGS